MLVNNRWDLFGDRYAMYQRLCRDLSEIRSSHYLRTDGKWGGYRHWVDAWKPALLEVPASDIDSLRRLSLSPHWKVMGLDSRRTIFGLAQLTENKPQIQAAARLLSELEWPSRTFGGELNGIIVATSRQERIAVARSLLALRLPYAALRVMPEPVRHDCEWLLAMSYFELAHRVFRQTRTHSLLDQYRAVNRLRRLLHGGRLSSRDAFRVARGLEELGEFEAAVEFAEAVQRIHRRQDSFDAEGRVEALIDRCRQRRTADDHAGEVSDPTAQLRFALQAGRRELALQWLSGLKGPARRFFGVLCEASEWSSEELYRAIIGQLNRKDFPSELRSEALFYLGSLAIEFGDSPGATDAFAASIQSDPSLPLNSISRVSLSNLRRPTLETPF